jgi:hypothetical protein
LGGILGPASGLHRLWRRLAHPVDPVAYGDALVGLRPANARQLLAVALAASDEADELLERLPTVLRSLSVSTASQTVRCEGELRGPVLWSETMAARSASPGAGGVYICASPVKAYDTDENRVLVAALSRILRAARAAESPEEARHPPLTYDLRHARHNGELTRRALEHRSLQAVSRVAPNGRMVQKARTGSKASVFRTAVALLNRSWAEVGADDLAPFVDERTRAEHQLAADVVDVLIAHDRLHDRLHLEEGIVVSGPFAYGHPEREAALTQGGASGVFVDGQAITSLAELANVGGATD